LHVIKQYHEFHKKAEHKHFMYFFVHGGPKKRRYFVTI